MFDYLEANITNPEEEMDLEFLRQVIKNCAKNVL